MIIRNAKLRGRKELADIIIEDGKFKEIAANLKGDFESEVDAQGNLVSPPFVESHVHLDSALTVGQPRFNESGTLLEGIEIWSEKIETLTKKDIKKNALEAVKWLIANGVLSIRTHADSTERSLMTLEAILEVKEEMKDYIDIQVVAFPQVGIFQYKEMDSLMESALKMGADVVGGIPQVEMTREDGIKSIDYIFQMAKKYNKLIDIHTDETGDDQSRFLEVIAKYTIENEMQGLVTASHATAMHNYDNDYAAKLIGLVKRSGVNIVTNPSSNALLQNRLDGYPRKRGTTRVDELLKEHVNVSIGNDNIMDPFGPLGKGNMLQAAYLLAHTAHLSGNKDIIHLFDMITFNGAKTLNIKDYGIKQGNSANFIILDAKDEHEAIRLTSEVLYVFKNGKMILNTKPARRNLRLREDYMIDFKI
nr:cytosine deaminase [Tissierella sp.]